MTFGLALFICVFLAILGMVVVSEFTSRRKSADHMIAGLDAEASNE
ncbi:hypothetical protein GCM10007094_37320 [Pseudovibrio japonicus]|uniref:Uncharacterized protein n=1 Tax=Pseudovibrio japonicus TaxID=366534 RepID=A0ABQ3ETL5_9HYPH|nr:hypothetical protein GCM10007094_37320 [Pseudovibrio japonicus]